MISKCGVIPLPHHICNGIIDNFIWAAMWMEDRGGGAGAEKAVFYIVA